MFFAPVCLKYGTRQFRCLVEDRRSVGIVGQQTTKSDGLSDTYR
jgi:hypothetical protein